MNGKEKAYAMAMMALVVIGLMAAWAAYSDTTTVSLVTYEVADVEGKGTITITIPKGRCGGPGDGGMFFSVSVQQEIFKLQNVSTKEINVYVMLNNLQDLVKYFARLDIKIQLVQGSNQLEEWIYLFKPQAIFPASQLGSFATNTDWSVKVVEISGLALHPDVPGISFYCYVEPTGSY